MPFLAAHCISSCTAKRRLGRASARRGEKGEEEPPVNNMGALSTPRLASGILRPTQESNKKTSCSSKCKRTSREKIPCYYCIPQCTLVQSQNLLIDGEITPIIIIIIIIIQTIQNARVDKTNQLEIQFEIKH